MFWFFYRKTKSSSRRVTLVEFVVVVGSPDMTPYIFFHNGPYREQSFPMKDVMAGRSVISLSFFILAVYPLTLPGAQTLVVIYITYL